MLKLTKKTDYGLIAMRHLAEHSDEGSVSAKDLAERYSIPQEAMAKILQKLARAGLLASQHGINGGYMLARDARHISALEVIRAIDGPLFIATCFSDKRGDCDQTNSCTVREPLRRVGESIQEVLGRLSIHDMSRAGDEPDKAELVTLV